MFGLAGPGRAERREKCLSFAASNDLRFLSAESIEQAKHSLQVFEGPVTVSGGSQLSQSCFGQVSTVLFRQSISNPYSPSTTICKDTMDLQRRPFRAKSEPKSCSCSWFRGVSVYHANVSIIGIARSQSCTDRV